MQNFPACRHYPSWMGGILDNQAGIHSVDLDKHLLSRRLGAVIKYRLVLRLPVEAVLQRIKRAWVLNQWFTPAAEINGRGWVVSKPCAAKGAQGQRLTQGTQPERALSMGSCASWGWNIWEANMLNITIFQTGRKENSRALQCLFCLFTCLLACLVIWVWKAWAPSWGDVHLISVYSAALGFCMGDHQQPDLMLGSAKPP